MFAKPMKWTFWQKWWQYFLFPAAVFDLYTFKMSVADIKKISDDKIKAKLNELIDIKD